MRFELSKKELNLLASLKQGVSQILIYKTGLYPTAVSFLLMNNKRVTLSAKGEDITYMFEVFPLMVTEKIIDRDSEKIFEIKYPYQPQKIAILQKSEWIIPLNEKEITHFLGDARQATTQYEGQSSEIPSFALNQATLHAGVEIKDTNGKPILVATSMFPYSLYVSECDFSEPIDVSVYEFLPLLSENNAGLH